MTKLALLSRNRVSRRQKRINDPEQTPRSGLQVGELRRLLMIFFFIWTWNEFYLPVVLLGDSSSQTIPIALATLRGQHAIEQTTITAGSFLSLLPTVIFFLIFQRTLSNGVTAGAIK